MPLAFSFLLAYLLDLVLGDPPDRPHPVRLIGRLCIFWEKLLYRPQVARGVFFWLAVMGSMAGLATLFYLASPFFPTPVLVMGQIYLIYTLLATRSLHDESRRVEEALLRGDLAAARKWLGLIVGRDTANLQEGDIRRAVLETIAENLNDGVVAPMFYLAALGLPGLLLYKTANTLDSMVGYKNERYLAFGRLSARLDDLLNYLPARLTALLLVTAAALFGADWLKAWQLMRRDARCASSPNAGWPEATLAGALGVGLGGPSSYFGLPVAKPYLGDPNALPSPAHYRQAIRLLYATSLLMAAFVFTVLYLSKAGPWGLVASL